MFIDEVLIRVKAGNGGNGILAFRREKFVPRGGPSGGDGGRGGDVILHASNNYNTLLHFRYNPEHNAERGRHGEGSNRKGREGRDVDLPVPIGTVVYDSDTGELLHDFTVDGDKFIIAHGGRGGKGNARFSSATHQAPTEHEDGFPGEERNLRLELKLLADVGLVGYPNAGKSTLISVISAARPKIANYPFTTLEPNLGVVQGDDKHTFVVADIPGIIEGAHEGVGLGIQFLRHVERCHLLLHLVDVSEMSGRKPGDDFKVILNELEHFSSELAAKPMFVVATKTDVAQDAKAIASLKQMAKRRGLPFYAISSINGDGIDVLKHAISEELFRDEPEAPLPRQRPPEMTDPRHLEGGSD